MTDRAALWGDRKNRLAFRCVGCNEVHVVGVTATAAKQWGWNERLDLPTLTPSILVTTGRAVDPNFVPEPGDPPEVCHSFVTDGRIQYLSDCSHALAGQTVDLPVFDQGE